MKTEMMFLSLGVAMSLFMSASAGAIGIDPGCFKFGPNPGCDLFQHPPSIDTGGFTFGPHASSNTAMIVPKAKTPRPPSRP